MERRKGQTSSRSPPRAAGVNERVTWLPGFPRGTAAVQTDGLKLGPEWSDSQLGGPGSYYLTPQPCAIPPSPGPVTEPVTPDTHFFLVLYINLHVLYRASQPPTPMSSLEKEIGSVLLAWRESRRIRLGASSAQLVKYLPSLHRALG